MSSPCYVFKTGKHAVKLFSVHQDDSQSSAAPPPPKPLLVSTPCEEGEFPVLIFLHGFLLYNSFYSQLLQHISSHGFIVVAPQVLFLVPYKTGLFFFFGSDLIICIFQVPIFCIWLWYHFIKHVRNLLLFSKFSGLHITLPQKKKKKEFEGWNYTLF